MRSGSVLFLKELNDTKSLALVSGYAEEFFFLVLSWFVISKITN
jgi:hypothetical protein